MNDNTEGGRENTLLGGLTHRPSLLQPTSPSFIYIIRDSRKGKRKSRGDDERGRGKFYSFIPDSLKGLVKEATMRPFWISAGKYFVIYSEYLSETRKRESSDANESPVSPLSLQLFISVLVRPFWLLI